MSETRPSDVPRECPGCARGNLFWTATDVICLRCRWHGRRSHRRQWTAAPPQPADTDQTGAGE
jgi:hypothetical protein